MEPERMQTGNGEESSQENVLGEGFKWEMTTLNQSFLSRVQEELDRSSDACLAPLVMDYLRFLYPLIKKGSEKDADFLEVAKFFEQLKRTLSSKSSGGSITGNGEITPLSGGGSGVSSKVEENENVKPSVPSKAPGPGFFGLPVQGSEQKSQVSSSLPAVTTTSGSSFFSTVAEPKTSSAFSQLGTMFTNPSSSSSGIGTSSGVTLPSSVGSLGATSVATTPSLPQFGFSSTTTKSTTSTSTVFGGFQASNTGFSFGAAPLSSSSGFGQFGSQIPSASASGGNKNVNGTGENKDDSDDETPPKPDFVPVVESDAVFTQRIKLFEMDGKKFKELGLANLFVKPLAAGKHQLIVRADNSLGTILVNAVLNSSIPIRQNKPTNILMTLPGSDAKPTTYLLRVKDASQGNEMLQALEKYKSQS